MTPIPKNTMSRLLSSQTSTATVLTAPLRATRVPFVSAISFTRSYHRSVSLRDKPSAPSPSSRTQQNKSRESFFWQRRDRKETRNRISTLALDPNATTEADTEESGEGSRQRQQSSSKDDTNSRDRLMSQNQRRILLFTVILSIPIVGRDVMEFIVPGLLGTIIFVGSKIKSGIKMVKRIGSGEGL